MLTAIESKVHYSSVDKRKSTQEDVSLYGQMKI